MVLAPAPASAPRSSVLPISSLVHKHAKEPTRVFCAQCSYGAAFPSDIRKHVRAVHTKERPFVCPYADCFKAFADKSNFRTHVRSAHTEGYKLDCPFPGCPKSFKHPASLRNHKLTHENRQFACSICLKTYANPPNVIRHLHRTHPGQGGAAVVQGVQCAPATASLETLAWQAAAILAQQQQ